MDMGKIKMDGVGKTCKKMVRTRNSGQVSQPILFTLTTLPKNKLIFPKMWGLRYQWNSAQMNNQHPQQLKKSKSWEPFWSYLQNSTANTAHLPQKWAKWAELAIQFSWQLQKPRILIFSIVVGAKPLFQLKFIAKVHIF